MCKSLWCCSLSPSGQRPTSPNVNPQASNQNVHNADQPAQILRPKCTAADTNVHLSINLQLRPEWTAGRMSCGPTYTNRDAMQCKAMQYGMQYYPLYPSKPPLGKATLVDIPWAPERLLLTIVAWQAALIHQAESTAILWRALLPAT